MNRIIFEKREIGEDGKAVLPPDDPRFVHMRDILHVEAGCPLKTGELGGLAGTSVVEKMDASGATVALRHDTEPPAPWLDMILALPRPRVYKRLLPQLAAVGVRRLVLAGAAKTEKAYWGAHWLRDGEARPLLVEGLAQCGATVPPVIFQERNFARFVRSGGLERMFGGQPVRYVAHPGKAAGAPNAVSASGPAPVLAIGPEGGWTDEEVGMLEEAGFERLALGPRILRTDTAAMALAGILMHFRFAA